MEYGDVHGDVLDRSSWRCVVKPRLRLEGFTDRCCELLADLLFFHSIFEGLNGALNTCDSG